MSLVDKFKGLSQSAQDGAKNATLSVFQIIFRLISGFFIGLTVALIGQEVIGYGSLGLILILLSVLSSIYLILSKWSIAHILIFDLICVLIATVLRMYILIAP